MTFTYRAVKDKPVGLWQMDSAANLDYSGYARNAPITGGTYGTPICSGCSSSLTVSKNFVATVPNPVFTQGQESQPFSLEAWVRPNQAASTSGTPGYTISPYTENLALNPHPVSTTNWQISSSGTGGASSFAYDATNDAVVGTVTTQPTDAIYAIRYGGSAVSNIPITVGQRYYATFEVMSTIADTRSFTLEWRTSTNTIFSQVDSTAATALPVNTWVKFEIFATAPSGAATAALAISQRVTGTASIRTLGSKLYVRRALLSAVPSDITIPYFDGGTPGATWSGAANASTSRMSPYVSGVSEIQILGNNVNMDGLTITGTRLDFVTKYLTTGECRASYDLGTLRAVHAVGVHTNTKNQLWVNGELVAETLITPTQLLDKFTATTASLYSGNSIGTTNLSINGIGVYPQSLTETATREHFAWGRRTVLPEAIATAYGGSRISLGLESGDTFYQSWQGSDFSDGLATDVSTKAGLYPVFNDDTSIPGNWIGAVFLDALPTTTVRSVTLDWVGNGITVATSLDEITWTPAAKGMAVSTVNNTTTAGAVLRVRVSFPGNIVNDQSYVESMTAAMQTTATYRPVSTRTITRVGGSPKYDLPVMEYSSLWGTELGSTDSLTISGDTAVDPETTRTIEWWGYVPVGSGGGFTTAGTQYVNGVNIGATANFPRGQWTLYHTVLPADATGNLVWSGGTMIIGQVVIYKDALTDQQISDIYAAYTSIPRLVNNDTSAIVITEPTAAATLYAHNWSITAAG